ncbi:hypothetical protein AMAG_03519 [Allomyces macrogynus ATCC 38327]|uniref:Uncharacterized protein n=1 Tax=Allomyces macrogynus (strain ATCC 38327) TaxID=578462 RepID=A0A0L0S9R5_ALLM3|nr:hypothetical protein AMAG_03519 [Allomyces macrogynus ATCC 38327]|eukprot:KNE59196.1 hypothetical protein AMAG_03519 [Allomyces macrogynus ATCC 38327]
MPIPAAVAQPNYERIALWPALPATTRGQSLQLSASPKGDTFLYTNGRSVVIRDLAKPEIASEYTGHSVPTTVARYSPSGYYIASADERGNVRIWDSTQPEQILKSEFSVLSGRINDLAWDSDSKRIIAVGEGRDKFGHAFLFDTGSSVGEIIGHSKVANAVSIRPNRPFRAVTCSDDMTVNFYHGTPYKFTHSLSDHSRFVSTVRYSPSGAYFASGALDGKIFLYDGAAGTKVKEITAENAHAGGIFALSWSADSRQFITSSADATVKLWDVETSQVVTTWNIDPAGGAPIEHQQVGNLWAGSWLVSASLNGQFNYLDQASGTVSRIVHGHSKNITTMAYDATSRNLYTASYDGNVRKWSEEDWSTGAVPVAGASEHTNQVSQLALSGDREVADVFTVSMDDTSRAVAGATFVDSATVKLPAQPTSVAVTAAPTRYVATVDGLVLVGADGAITAENAHAGGIFALSWSADSRQFITSSADATVKLWDVETSQVVTTWNIDPAGGAPIEHQQVGNLWAGSWLVSASLNGQFNYLDQASGTVSRIVHGHSKNITTMAYDATSRNLYTASYDGNVRKWSEEDWSTGAVPVAGASEHTNQVSQLALSGDREVADVFTVSMDDTSRAVAGATFVDSATVKLPAQPTSVAVTAAPTRPVATCENARAAVTALAFSPDASLLAVGDAGSKIHVYDVAAGGAIKLHQWVFHTARVTSVSWAADGLHAVSTSLDTSVIVWSVERPMKHVIIRNAHTEAATAAAFVDADVVVSAGNDSAIKHWKIKTMP